MLLDTSGLLCLHHVAEPYHKEAASLYVAASASTTHNYILAEFVALSHSRRLPRDSSLAYLRGLVRNPKVEIVWVGEALTESALSLLERQLDKTYSLCDAVSFLLMRERGITEALTTDHHFEQAGFVRLLN